MNGKPSQLPSGIAQIPCRIAALVLTASAAASYAGQPVLAPIPDMTVYVREPVRLGVKADDPSHSALTYAVSGLPAEATVNASTGEFSWAPAMQDAGAHTATFTVSDGSAQASMQVVMTVVMPTLAAGQVTRVLRPNGGETYRYGDTINVALVTLSCSDEAQIFVKYGNNYRNRWLYTPQRDDRLVLNGPAVDARGVDCRFFYSFPDLGVNVGFYRLALHDTTVGANPINFGGDTAVVDSLKILVNDPYGNEGPCLDPAEGMSLLTGDASDGFFKVVPSDLPMAIRHCSGKSSPSMAGTRRSVAPGTSLYDLRGACVGTLGGRAAPQGFFAHLGVYVAAERNGGAAGIVTIVTSGAHSVQAVR